MHTLLLTSADNLIPLVAIGFTFMVPILTIYFYYKHKEKIMDERRLMIEKGMTPPPLKENFESARTKTPLTKGLNMIAIALGLLVGYFISANYDIKAPFSYIGSILFFLGIVNVTVVFLEPKENSSHLKNSEHENQ